jgi:DNA-binding NtrC family response regulator
MTRVFIVEDNESIREAVAGCLKLEEHEVVSFASAVTTVVAIVTSPEANGGITF